MALKVAFQMDHVRSVNIDTDSTFVLALEAEKRGHALYHYLPRQLAFAGGRLTATAESLRVRRKRGDHFTLGQPKTIDLADMDVVMLRQDPPFDMGYVTTTHLLEHVHPKTLVVNDPKEVRNAPEKLSVTRFPDLMPPTLISSERDRIRAFREEHKDIILKPLFGNGGAGVFHVGPRDENLNALLEMFTQFYREPIVAQKYLPGVRKGDKRIILIDGEAAGAIIRVPAEGEARANLHVGARPMKAKLSRRDKEICDAIGPDLQARGLIFVGIDVIGEYLTEINVTSPTGIQEINRFDKTRLEARVWDAIEKKLKDRI